MVKKVLNWGLGLEKALLPSFCINCSLVTPEEPPALRWLCLKCHQILTPRWEKVSFKPDIAESYYLFDYQKDFLAKKLIHALKYNFVKEIGATLGVALEKERLHLRGLVFDFMVPVPLHPKRLKNRGFNQSFLLAQKIGEITEKPVLENVLARKMARPPQMKIKNRSDREKNIQGIFECAKPSFVHLAGKVVLLVDDVATTGATIKECARVLKNAGAVKVISFTLAQD